MNETQSFSPQDMADSFMNQIVQLSFDEQNATWHLIRGMFLEYRLRMIKEKSEMARDIEKTAKMLTESTQQLIEGQFDPAYPSPKTLMA